MKSVAITFENYTDYPAGTTVEFCFGAYYPVVEGVVTGYKVLPESKFFPAAVCLVAEYKDIETGDTVETTITRFSECGVGTRLLEVAEKPKVKSTSPWAA